MNNSSFDTSFLKGVVVKEEGEKTFIKFIEYEDKGIVVERVNGREGMNIFVFYLWQGPLYYYSHSVVDADTAPLKDVLYKRYIKIVSIH